ncbi:hypothetical protein Ocin01_05571 [Orchesella cincta]|uniref:Uncharacterized protein n=1 Tax=Orchesella cincta TaxID=48709 RepID=A0A1D2N765_ORCCI|nr:hypothetical protein Ocin01_05571 [Orchesella cincta]
MPSKAKAKSTASSVKKKSIFERLFSGPTQIEEDPFPVLNLPQSVRVRIWNILGYSYTRSLRLTCQAIKDDIDTVVGISSAIDSTYDDFPFHCDIAVRKVAIHELIDPVYVQFLKYPLVLNELEIRGEISLQNFNYIIKSCPNIAKLTIIFNKFVIEQGTPMFPLSSEVATGLPLQNLNSIRIIASTKKFQELFYVYRNVISILRDCAEAAKITNLQLHLTHKGSTIYLKEIAYTTLVFIHKRAATLRFLNLMFRDKDPAGEDAAPAPEEPPKTQAKPASPRKSSSGPITGPPARRRSRKSVDLSGQKKPDVVKRSKTGAPTDAPPKPQSSHGSGRRDTGVAMIASSHSVVLPGVHITHHTKELHTESPLVPKVEGAENEAITESDGESTSEETNDKITDAIKFLDKNPWNKAVWLEQLFLILPFKVMQYVPNILSPKTKLRAISLEALGANKKTWEFYVNVMKAFNGKKLRNATFCGVNHVDDKGLTRRMDLGIFKQCVELKRLTIQCRKKDNFTLFSRASNVSRLPKSLQEIVFERLLLTPTQILRLLFCFTKMTTVSVSYWSINDCQFSVFMSILKWIVQLDLTDVTTINLVDFKIRFKNKRRAVRQLQEAVTISVKYQDFDETRLLIDSRSQKDSTQLAPRISVIKITAPLKKPKRIKRNKVDTSLSETAFNIDARNSIH